MEDVVDAHLELTATHGVHEAFATLLETVDKVAQHGVVDIGIGHIVEVAADNNGDLGVLYLTGYLVSLTGPDGHTASIIAVDGSDDGVVLNMGAAGSLLGNVVQGAVEAGGLEVDVEDAYLAAVDIDINPHAAVVRIAEIDNLGLAQRVAAVDRHVAASQGHIGEIGLVGLRVEFIASGLVVLLNAHDVYALLPHLREDVLGLESRNLASESLHIVSGYLKARRGAAAVEQTCLVDGAEIGDAAEQGDDGYAEPYPPAANEPVDHHDDIADEQVGQHIDEHGHSGAGGGVDITSEKTEEREDGQQRADDQNHKRDVLEYCLLAHG